MVEQVLQLLYGSCVIISGRYGHGIEACHRKQLCKAKLLHYKPLLHIYSHLKQITRLSDSVLEVDVLCIGIVHVLRLLVAWAADKRLLIIYHLKQLYYQE